LLPNMMELTAELAAVLITKRPLKLLNISPVESETSSRSLLMNSENYRSQIAKWAKDTERIVDLMRLAVLLASPDEDFFAAQYVSRTVLQPLQLEPDIQWRGGDVLAPSPQASLGFDTLARVLGWAEVTMDHPQQLDIAMRRTLSAVTERTDPLDGFIDAVLAWENMFSGRPETNLRVCGAIAWLLEPDNYDRRSGLFTELKALYSKRSNLVHGAIETLEEAANYRDRSVRISIEAMKRLYANDKLLKAKRSDERGGMALMGIEQDHHMLTQDDTIE
jgi:Apea-like HEPN